jgi:hypothetical protein
LHIQRGNQTAGRISAAEEHNNNNILWDVKDNNDSNVHFIQEGKVLKTCILKV